MISQILARNGVRSAVVLDDFLHTLGGGERSCLSYARALRAWGLDVEVWTRTTPPSRDVLAATFGRTLSDVPCRGIRPEAFQETLRKHAPEVFIQHTFGHFDPNPARIGFYVQMFPAFRLEVGRDAAALRALATYNRIIAISEFARRHTVDRWAVDARRMTVLYPPIDAAAPAPAGSRRPQIVHVGRFNPSMHSKNQHVLIEQFLAARMRYAELADWRLILVGQVNDDTDSRAYFAACEELARRAPEHIVLKPALAAEALWPLLAESFAYVHATGAFIPEPDEPERCEHFGLSVLEAMARGCVPLVYARGGILEVLQPGLSGLVYRNPQELMDGFRELARLRGTRRGTRLQRAAMRAAGRMHPVRFRRALGRLLLREVWWPSPTVKTDNHG